jgi:hypothetical protein
LINKLIKSCIDDPKDFVLDYSKISTRNRSAEGLVAILIVDNFVLPLSVVTCGEVGIRIGIVVALVI